MRFNECIYCYCPIVWMFDHRSLNNKINSLNECCLKIIYNDKRSTFEKLLAKNNLFFIHHNNTYSLSIEM